MPDIPQNETRTKILDIAERLFSERGYAAVRLRDIASEAGMKHASLYYYAPGGKEGLFMEVMVRSFERHYAGMMEAVDSAEGDLRAQLYAVADWMLGQPPMDFTRMINADVNEISEANARLLMDVAFDSLRIPLEKALNQAEARGLVEVRETGLAAMTLVSLMQSAHTIPHDYLHQRSQIVRTMIDMLLDGMLKT